MAIPTITQRKMIELMNRVPGADHPVPATEAIATSLIDDLIDQERASKRADV